MKKGFKGHDSGAIKRVLQNVWNLKPTENSLTYLQHRFGSDGIIHEHNVKGRFYQLSEKQVLKLNNIDAFDAEDLSN